ncbi:GGDEF domain-containing protein [Sulfurovum sp. bin170]|uniref:GGDEF domain-containing protein n=1 Tax=Sulfurovum sp. bin170 TaxID=2695268 RepID=UPI0013DFFBBC|nr:GGDEF domain-containing protein [Sulfurovum sp. bin170]NEW60182.1 GGDEF domain-containing protein [Sulfurovum sp. bin170]
MGFFTKDNKFNLSLDIHDNVMIVSSNEEVKYINKAGLKFFGFNSFSDFKDSHKHGIDTLFIEDDGCINRYSLGKKWLTIIDNKKSKIKRKTIKVKLHSHIDEMSQYFYIRVTNLKSDEYLLSFCNVNDIEIEKNDLIKQADYDLLTQIYNRVKFNKVFPLAIDKALMFNETFSLILFDIDHFKSINDTFGHAIGDKVLFELSRIVNMKIRKTDIFARWGGEEFIVVAKYATLQEAKKIAETLRKLIESHNFGDSLKITCSFGVTEFTVSDSQRGIFQRVDDALYEAKDGGRNQVVDK